MNIDDNIAQLMDLARAAMTNARSAEGRLSSFTPTVSGGDLAYTASTPKMPAPTSLSDLLAADNSTATIAWLDAESEKWLDKYFPEIQACLRSSPEEWLCGIITGQEPFGLSQAAFEAVWHESRDRENRSRNTAVRNLNMEFSSRGFSLPVGPHVAAIMRAEQDASDAIAQVNRTQTLRDSEIKLDLLKFAEEQALSLKQGIMRSMADFYRQWIDLPNKSLEAGRLKTQAYATFQQSLSSYYNVQLGFEELRLQAANLRMNGKLDQSRIRVASSTGDTRNTSLAQAARAYGDISAAAASAASTLTAQIATGGA